MLKGALEGYDAEFGSSEGFEGTVDGADGGAGGGNNDNFVGTVIRLIWEVVNCDEVTVRPAYHGAGDEREQLRGRKTTSDWGETREEHRVRPTFL